MNKYNYEASVECKATNSTQTKRLNFIANDYDFSGKSMDELTKWASPKVKSQNKSALKGFKSVKVNTVYKRSKVTSTARTGRTSGNGKGLISRLFGMLDSFLGD